MKTTENIFDDTAIIVSDGCCVQLANNPALDDVTFEIKKGKKVAVVGPNGGGKSTLFNAIAGLVPIINGSLKINGMSPKEAKGTISYVPQRDLINKNFPLSVKQVVEMGLINKNTLNLFSRKEINLKIKEALTNVGLSEKINENINNLSGGQFQRVLIARGLAQDADILLLDEPSAGLSPVAIKEVFEIVKEINSKGVAILLVEQNAKRALNFSDRGYVLDQGRNAYQGKGQELLNDPRVVDLYLGKL